MKKNIIRISISVFSFILKNRIIKIDKEKVLVNLGCGLRCLPNWINIDGSPTAFLGSRRYSLINRFLYKFTGASAHYSFKEYNEIIQKSGLHFFDLRHGIPFKNENVDVIYSSHFIEHIKKEDAQNFLKGCYRALKGGGLMRLVVPDLDFAFEMYKNGQINEMLERFFYTSPDLCDFAAHKYGYNFLTLENILEEIGFIDVKKVAYQRGNCPNIDFLDIYPDYSLYVEFRKNKN